MPSERRLHPLSILFNVAKQFGALLIPIAVVVMGRGSDEDRWSVYAAVFLVPYFGVAVLRYLSFRYRYEERELVIRQGFIFKNQRHVPYGRIQNIDAVQNLFHRLMGVVEVRVQTGGGSEPEATLSVLAREDLEEMRRRVFGGARIEDAPDTPASQVLLHLSPRELALYGLIENKGFVVIAAALGLLSEFNAMPQFVEKVIGEEEGSQSLLRRAARTMFEDGPTSSLIFYGLLAFVLFLLVSRVFSVIWAQIRLHGYSLVQVGEDLRAEYGLFTRVTATVPRRRIQSITIRDTPLHRLLGRASVRVATAGGAVGAEGKTPQHREWLAPIMKRDDLPALLAVIMPGVDLSTLDWRGVHPRAFRRRLNRGLFGAVVLTGFLSLFVGPRGLWLLPILALWTYIRARRYIAYLGWTETQDVVAVRQGAFVRTQSIAPLVKIQAVEQFESPFDRRWQMATVHADAAGGGIGVPYLPVATAQSLYGTLSEAAAHTRFKW